MRKNDYLSFIKEGDQYLKAAHGGLNRPAIFSSEILYNIIGLSIEKLVMGALICKGKLADNHTFTDLIDATNQVGGINKTIADQLRKFESYQNICPVFAGYHRADPPREAIHEMLATAEAIQAWSRNIIDA